jgi:carbonic anhydrase
MVYLEPGNMSLPYFSLRSERIAHKIWAAFGYQDIDFGNRPGFSREYLLRGPDEQAIRNVFNDGLLSFYEMYLGTCTDGGGNQLFVYRENYRWEPQQIQPLIGLGLGVLNLLPRHR